MSRLLKSAELKVSSLVLPGRWDDDLDTVTVERLREQIEAGVPMAAIRINRKLEVVQGLHRIKAHQDAGRKTIRCDVVEYQDALEQEADTIAENLYRRVLSPSVRDRSLARLVQIKLQRSGGELDGDGLPPASFDTARGQAAPGARHEKLTKTAAIRDVAAERGVSERMVERAVERQSAPAPAAREPQLPQPNRFRDFNLPIPEPVRAAAVAAQHLLDQAVHHLEQAQAHLKKLEQVASFDTGTATDLRRQVKTVAGTVRQYRPAGLCPWCKAVPGLDCNHCHGLRMQLELKARADLDGELLLEGDRAMVSYRGDYVPRTKVVAQQPPEINGVKGGKRPEVRR